MTVPCNRGCGKTWPRDPILEIACPSCRAKPGSQCRRPSGHRAAQYHAERDILADRQGHYGPCPWGRCGLDNVARRKADSQMELI